MRNVANKMFGLVAAGALALAPTAAFAEETATPANQNVAASVQPVAFSTFDDSTRSERFVMAGAAQASHDKIAIIVWGGTRELQQQAYNAALDLRDQGIPLAFILGPRLLPSDAVASFQVYANGAPMYEGNGASIGTAHVDQVRPTVVRMGRNAYRDAFTTEVATLSLN